MTMNFAETRAAQIRELELSYAERVNMAVAEDRYDLVDRLAAAFETELSAFSTRPEVRPSQRSTVRPQPSPPLMLSGPTAVPSCWETPFDVQPGSGRVNTERSVVRRSSRR
jgi:hypothetical protein